MPELPEAECARRLLETELCGRIIEEVFTNESGGGPRDGLEDDLVLADGLSGEAVVKALKGRRVSAAMRKGKQLWCLLDGEGPHPLFHFGMTGAFTVMGVEGMTYRSTKIVSQESWPPRYTKFELLLSGGVKVAFTDPRRLARIRLRVDPPSEEPISALGRDPYLDPPSLPELILALAGINAPIKAVLLDQNRVVSGVGNYLADEVCYQAKIHPASPCSSLDEAQMSALHTSLVGVVAFACSVNASYKKFPQEWLFHYRWGKGKGGSQDFYKNSIAFETVGGRTTAIVAKVQKKGRLSARASTSSKPAAKANAKAKTKAKAEAKGETKGKAVKEEDLKQDVKTEPVADAGVGDIASALAAVSVRTRRRSETSMSADGVEEDAQPTGKRRRRSVAVKEERGGADSSAAAMVVTKSKARATSKSKSSSAAAEEKKTSAPKTAKKKASGAESKARKRKGPAAAARPKHSEAAEAGGNGCSGGSEAPGGRAPKLGLSAAASISLGSRRFSLDASPAPVSPSWAFCSPGRRGRSMSRSMSTSTLWMAADGISVLTPAPDGLSVLTPSPSLSWPRRALWSMASSGPSLASPGPAWDSAPSCCDLAAHPPGLPSWGGGGVGGGGGGGGGGGMMLSRGAVTMRASGPCGSAVTGGWQWMGGRSSLAGALGLFLATTLSSARRLRSTHPGGRGGGRRRMPGGGASVGHSLGHGIRQGGGVAARFRPLHATKILRLG